MGILTTAVLAGSILAGGTGDDVQLETQSFAPQAQTASTMAVSQYSNSQIESYLLSNVLTQNYSFVYKGSNGVGISFFGAASPYAPTAEISVDVFTGKYWIDYANGTSTSGQIR